MDFGENYFKAYLRNTHSDWGIYSHKAQDIIYETHHKTMKEVWDIVHERFGAGHEVVALFPQDMET